MTPIRLTVTQYEALSKILGAEQVADLMNARLIDFHQLTSRDVMLVDLLCSELGLSNKEIAAIMETTVTTVKNRLTAIYRKLDIPDRLLLSMAWQNELFKIGLQELGFINLSSDLHKKMHWFGKRDQGETSLAVAYPQQGEQRCKHEGVSRASH
jgi:DNA-binding CsgD family transcriptional regulator